MNGTTRLGAAILGLLALTTTAAPGASGQDAAVDTAAIIADATLPATRVSLVNGQLGVAEMPLPGSPSRQNKVTVTGGGTSWKLSDPGGVAPGPGCITPPTGGTSVECAGAASSVSAVLAGGNDTFKFTSAGASLTVEVDGGDGNDTITVTGGNPTIDGGYNDDVITVADNYSATIYGGPGYLDKISTGRILGSSGATNHIYPGPVNREAMVYDGWDVVNGGPERDYVHSSKANTSQGDEVDGGDGFDTQDYSDYTNVPVVVSTDDNAANDGSCTGLIGAHGDNIHSDVERIIGTDVDAACQSPANPNLTAIGDILIGSSINNTLDGRFGGHDYVHGRGGDDIVTGEEAVGGTDRDHITGVTIRARDNFADRSITCQGNGHAYLDTSDPTPSGNCTVHRESTANAAVSLAIDELALNGFAGGFGL